MNPAEIITLINIASQLAEVINNSVEATDDAQVKAAWLQAQAMFNKGYLAAYPVSMNVPVTGKMPTDE